MKSKKHIFTQMEKKVFLAAVRTYASIIENRSTDSSMLRKKELAWYNITKEYNASPHSTTETTNKQLRRLWNNLKHRQKLVLKKRQHRIVADGEPSPNNVKMDPDRAQIAPDLIVEINGTTDSDTSLESFPQSKDTIIEKEYRDKFKRASEIHLMEKELLSYRIREAKAKAELAELIFQQRSKESNLKHFTDTDKKG